MFLLFNLLTPVLKQSVVLYSLVSAFVLEVVMGRTRSMLTGTSRVLARGLGRGADSLSVKQKDGDKALHTAIACCLQPAVLCP